MNIKKHLNFTSMRCRFSTLAAAIPDWRDAKKVTISIHDALLSGFACMFFQDPSLLQFQKRMEEKEHRSNLKTMFGVKNIPKETQMREIIDNVDSDALRPIFKDVYLNLQRGKHLEQYQLLDKMYYFPIDGSQFFSSKDIHCEQCLTKTHNKTDCKLIFVHTVNKTTQQDVMTKGSILIIKNDKTYKIGFCTKKTASYQENELNIDDSSIRKLLAACRHGDEIIGKSTIKKLYKVVESLGGMTAFGTTTYSHQVLQGGIMHPDCKQIIPFMPEQIVNADGSTKQDCEMNAGKRYISTLRQDFPQLKFLIGGDALFSKQPIIEDIISQRMHYLFVAKPTDHTYMMQQIAEYKSEIKSLTFIDEAGRTHTIEWMNKVPLNGAEETVTVNLLRYQINGINKKGVQKTLYQNSWVTDILISEKNCKILVAAGRCRWKNENECFNVMKNHGYYMEHNYGHGKEHLAYNFYLLTLLAFTFHQIFELTDTTYQKNRKKFGSKKSLWEALRNYIRIIIFESWEVLLSFALKPTSYHICPTGRSP